MTQQPILSVFHNLPAEFTRTFSCNTTNYGFGQRCSSSQLSAKKVKFLKLTWLSLYGLV